MKRPHIALACLLLTLLSQSLSGAELAVEFELPQLAVAEYHRPYVAVWLEDSERRQILQLAVWVEQEKWHRDLRSWWRRGGKRVNLPVDGVSGPTRKPGRYQVRAAARLAPGEYTLNLEAVREVGGREHIRIPFSWDEQPQQYQMTGTRELGAVRLSILPE